VVEADAIRAAGQVEPPPRLDAGADREHEQRLAAGVGHVAPRGRGAAVQAREVRRADAGRRAAEAPPASVPQLENALAAEQRHRAAPRQGGHVSGGAGRRRQPSDAGRSAAGERPDGEQEARA
jgi:hypothetical protein